MGHIALKTNRFAIASLVIGILTPLPILLILFFNSTYFSWFKETWVFIYFFHFTSFRFEDNMWLLILSFIFLILGTPSTVICSLVGLRQILDAPQTKGKVLAIIGLVIGIIDIVLLCLYWDAFIYLLTWRGC